MIVCFDIGGTSIKGALAQDPETIKIAPRIPTPRHDFDAFVKGLESVVAQAPGTPGCISISIAGIIEPDDGKAIVANIPCLHGRRMKDDLEAALGLPVLIANDADCFALAEAELGAGAGHSVVFGIILGTGVGGGLVVDGKLINRKGGSAGEWGHGPVAATQVGNPVIELPRFRCGCGLEGCLDATCSARGLEKLHKHIHHQVLTAEEILSQWQQDQQAATVTVDVYIELLTGPMAMMVNATGASILPVGGGLSNVRALLEAIDVAVRGKILRATHQPIVVPATNRIEPGIVGAAILGHQFLLNQ